MNKIVSLLAAAAMLTIVSCGNNQNKANSSFENIKVAKTVKAADVDAFTIDVPTGWTRKLDDIKVGKQLFLMAPVSDGFQPNLNVLQEDMQGRDLDAYVEYNLKHMGPVDVQTIDQSDIEVNGIKGKLLKFKMNYQNRDMVIGSYIIPGKNGIAFVVTTTALVSQYPALAATFDKTVHSFKLK
ncbi:hypothetical protein SNE25_17690 [Mucilaginibacter sabulilitoris]|uniref:PsbP C-terminal domain-containing protein n=1 Tax=Mucilaginibacter sabulilitoris TaxID=1173583 RepID=A0ABZ0TDU8_9SPHI|nr:hypothetical protein [Mucilaginibacter sabulilitoris]WPU91153.1 hypothetical protein SNE25_17690 [Mucilaginibacter sabulilitoris]